MTYLYAVSSGILQSKLLQCNGHVGRRTVRSPIHERYGVREVILIDGSYRPRPDLDTLMLKEQKSKAYFHIPRLEKFRFQGGILV